MIDRHSETLLESDGVTLGGPLALAAPLADTVDVKVGNDDTELVGVPLTVEDAEGVSDGELLLELATVAVTVALAIMLPLIQG